MKENTEGESGYRPCGGSLRSFASAAVTARTRRAGQRFRPPSPAAAAPAAPLWPPALIHAGLRRYALAIWRRGWVSFGLAVVAVGGQLALDFRQPRLFQAKAQLWMAGALVVPKTAYYDEPVEGFLTTQMVLLRSPRILRAAAERTPGLRTADSLPKLNVEPEKKASLLVLTAVSPDASLASGFLRAVIQSYLDYRRGVQVETRDDTASTLLEELARREAALREAEARRDTPQGTNVLRNLEQERTAAASYTAMLRQELGELQLQDEWLGSTPARDIFEWSTGMQAAAGLGNLRAARNLRPVGDSSAGLYQQAREELQVLRFQRDDLGQYLKPKHPKIVALDDRIRQREALFESLAADGVQQVQQARGALAMQKDALQRSLNQSETKLIELNRRIRDAEELELEVRRQRLAFERISEMLQRINVSRSLQTEMLKVMDEPAVEPLSRWRPMRTAAALPGGLLTGVLLVLLIESRRRAVVDATTLPERLAPRLWAELPQWPIPTDRSAAGLRALLDSPAGEALRELRAALRRPAAAGRAFHVLLVMGWDATASSASLLVGAGAALAAVGERILLIDANLRQPSLDDWLEDSTQRGLAQALAGEADWAELVRPGGPPGLWMLPAGKPHAAPGDLVIRPAWTGLIEAARAAYDRVLVAVPPPAEAADVFALAPAADGVLLLLPRGRVPCNTLERTVARLERGRARVVGCVLVG